ALARARHDARPVRLDRGAAHAPRAPRVGSLRLDARGPPARGRLRRDASAQRHRPVVLRRAARGGLRARARLRRRADLQVGRHVLGVVEVERPEGVIVQFGGQTPLRLAAGLRDAGVPILGTSVEAIDAAEDRGRFGALLAELGYEAPPYATAHSVDEALREAPG